MLGSSLAPPSSPKRRLTHGARSHPASSGSSGSPLWLRRCALAMTLVFAWTMLLALPAQALTRPTPPPVRPGVRVLPLAEMQKLWGQQFHVTSLDPASGSTFAWEGTVGGTNTGNGNKLTQIPVMGWTQRGGLPVSFTLAHNSQSTHNSELGQKWTHSFDIYLVQAGPYDDGTPVGAPSEGSETVHWGDDLSYVFANSSTFSSPVFNAPTGIYDTLVKNVDATFTLTTKMQVKYHFDTSGYCDTITDTNGNAITISHNTGHYVTSVTDATSRVLSLSYDTSNRISTLTDPLSRVWTRHYDTSNNLSQVDWPLLTGQTVGTNYHVSLSYNAAHDLTTLTSPGGRASTYTYNSSDNSLASETDGCSNTTTYAYASGATTITDANGHATVHNYSSGRLSSETDAASHSVSRTYDSSNNVTQTTDERGKIWAATYDSMGNRLTSTDPLSNVTTTTYNSHNRPLTVTDPLSHVTTLVYDTHDNCTSASDGLSHTTTLAYSTYGQLTSTTDPLSHVTTLTYDGDGNCDSSTDALSHTTDFTSNGLGWRTLVSDALSHCVTTSFDNWGRVASVTTAAGTVSTVYDPDDNATSVTDANSHTSTTTYDNDGRPLVVTSANGDTFTHSYDGFGQKGLLSSTTDGNSHTTSYAYDSLNRKSSVSYPDSTGESWTYDNASNLASHTDGNSHTISYSYDDAGKLTGVSYPTGTGAGTGVSYTFDSAGRRTGMSDVTGSTGFTYDAANRLTQLSQPNGTTNYGYDNANRRTSLTVSGVTGSWAYAYDNANRLSSTTNPYSETASNTYDAANRLIATTNGNSSISSYVYDASNRTTEVYHKNSSLTPLAHYGYTYDPGGNVSSRTDTNGTVTTFSYDDSDQITGEIRDTGSGSNGYTLSYGYDHNHNRTSLSSNVTGSTVNTTLAYDAHDKLSSATIGSTSKTYGYDSNGNCTSVTLGSSVTSLTYDIENRVIGITYPSSATNSFAYNGEDLRVQKVDSTGTQNFVTDGATPASNVLKDGNAVYTPGLSERRGSTSKFTHADALGSTRGITDSSQTVTDTQLYDAFGNTLSRTGTTPTPFGFVGKSQYQADSDSGLQLLGHRYYDPSIGRFLSSDPAKAGTNWYAYCNNNPLGRTDPQGLDDAPHQAANFLLGEAKAALDHAIEGIFDPIMPGAILRPYVPASWLHPFAPPSRAQGGNESQANGYEFGKGLLFIAEIVAMFAGGGCFVAGTPVQMADGKTKPIEKVRRGDRVRSRSELSGKNECKKVTRKFKHTAYEIVKLVLAEMTTGKVVDNLRGTPEHPFFTPSGMVAMGELKPEMKVITRRGPPLVVQAVTREPHPEGIAVYNFEVEGDHTYFVGKAEGGTWVHNECNFIPKNLQHEFSGHAPDFGVTGNWNKANSEAFKQAILTHIANAPQQITGTFRGNIPVTHYFDPASGLWAAVDNSGNFVAGWKLYPSQIADLLTQGNVK